jgi:hypothetical protein
MAEPVMTAPVVALVMPVMMTSPRWLAGQQARSRRRQAGLRHGLALGS